MFPRAATPLAFAFSALAMSALAACSGEDRVRPEPASGFPKIERFEASASGVEPGGRVSLSYKVVNAETVEITPDVLTPAQAVLEGMVETGPLQATTTFTLRATSEKGHTTRQLTVMVETSSTAVRIVSFSATPEQIGPGRDSTLAWSVVNATSIRVGIDNGAELVSNGEPDGMLLVQPADTTTYVLRAEGEGGPVEARITVVIGKLPEIISLVAEPAEINPGEQSTITWELSAEAAARLSDETGAVIAESAELIGAHIVSPASTHEYLLEVENTFGTSSARVTVRVIGADRPRIDRFSVSPAQLTAPGTVTLEWESSGADTVTLTADGVPDGSFPGGDSGAWQTTVAATTVFELRAQNAFGETTQQATVTLLPPQDGTPPVIDHTPVLAMQTAGTAVTIEATITDDGAGVGGAILWYRAMGAASFQSVSMTSAGDTFTAMIPAAAVQPPGVEYYLEAADLAAPPNPATHPATAPAMVHTFQVSVLDQTAPSITHTAIGNGQLAGTAVEISATITDADSGVGTATLFYRRTGAGAFSSVAMTPEAQDRYRATIPAAAVQAPGMEYYIEATDGAATVNRSTSPAGAPGSTHTFTVTAIDTSAPVITHTPVANGQTAGGAVQVSATVTDATGVAVVRLFYRRQGTPTYASATMVLSAGAYSANIPAAAVQPPGVDYYLEATDTAPAANTARSPAAAPATSHGFTVTMIDNTAPSITHSAVASPQLPGQAVAISAQVTDATGVGTVTLFYRPRGAAQFTSVAMTGGPAYGASIPASAVEPPGVEYYLRAQDTAPAANAGTSPAGAPTTLHVFAVGLSEVEPNNTTGTATLLIAGARRNNAAHGSIAPAADHDYYAVDVPAGAQRWNLRAEITAGGPATCPSPISTILRLYGTDGTTLLVSDSFDGIGNCSLIDPAADSAARALPAGRYYLRVEENGDNATIGAYELTVTLSQTRCGNNIVEIPANEQCDDGNTSNGDGCSSTCSIEPEGVVTPPLSTFNGDISPAGDTDLFAVDVTQGQFVRAEITDGVGGCPGDMVLDFFGSDGTTLLGSDDDDGTGLCPLINPLADAFARNLTAGRYFLRARAAVSTDTISGYRLRVEVLNGICGNGAVESGEQCDDSNTSSFDGCDASCQWETQGTANGMGASFTGGITPVGNRDFYAIVVQQGDSIRAETFAPNDGECTSGNDTVIRLYAADRTTEIISDDQDGIGSCSLLDPANDLALRNLAAGTYYLAVEDYLNNSTITRYVLNVEIRRPGCGNGWLDGADVCDDGNTSNGDGCSATCGFEGPAETEPNDTSATATTLLPSGQTQASLLGSVSSSGDLDVYRITVPSGYSVWAEISDGNGGCPNAGSLRLRSTNGTTSLVFDATDGPGSCGQISPARDSGARNLTAGDYYLEVSSSGGSAAYRLQVRVLAPGCGDFVVGASEVCDDGNTVGGDGCSATCSLEGNSEIEPNNTTASATPLITGTATSAVVLGSLSSTTDLDVFSVVVPAGYHLIAELSDGAGRCPNSGSLRLRSSAGTSLATDTSDGPESCGRLSPGFDSAARALTGGTYYVEVYGSSASTAVYTLSVRVVPPNACGNVYLDAGELCDDGNTRAGDGCSATCQLEVNESEANDTSATADAIGPAIRTFAGAIAPNDEDWFSLTVADGASLTIFTHNGGLDQCPDGTGEIDSIVELRASNGTTVVASDDDDGPGLCSRIEAAEASNLTAGTYYLRVTPYSSSMSFNYVVTVEIR